VKRTLHVAMGGGVEERMLMGVGRKRGGEEEEEKEIERKEIWEAIRRLNEGKAIGRNGITREA